MLIEYFQLALSKYAEFDGRSRRSEYWYFTLGNVILSIIAGILDSFIGMEVLDSILSLALFIPGLAVAVRRLHDIGKSGWWILIFLTVIGVFVLIYWYCQDSEPGRNEYGPNPKDPSDEEDDIMDHLVDEDLV